MLNLNQPVMASNSIFIHYFAYDSFNCTNLSNSMQASLLWIHDLDVT